VAAQRGQPPTRAALEAALASERKRHYLKAAALLPPHRRNSPRRADEEGNLAREEQTRAGTRRAPGREALREALTACSRCARAL